MHYSQTAPNDTKSSYCSNLKLLLEYCFQLKLKPRLKISILKTLVMTWFCRFLEEDKPNISTNIIVHSSQIMKIKFLSETSIEFLIKNSVCEGGCGLSKYSFHFSVYILCMKPVAFNHLFSCASQLVLCTKAFYCIAY